MFNLIRNYSTTPGNNEPISLKLNYTALQEVQFDSGGITIVIWDARTIGRCLHPPVPFNPLGHTILIIRRADVIRDCQHLGVRIRHRYTGS